MFLAIFNILLCASMVAFWCLRVEKAHYEIAKIKEANMLINQVLKRQEERIKELERKLANVESRL